ncbi:ATP-binding protein [Streptomyces kunmingensis]|uniref:ATP-binding protein n=1 Tax=Streptomyces kunmingensis TaxID=68225 RepID=A0ABU6CNV7_9ACTN|nr:ATP-binding protein [Streptomyces kunmingensis]MEB3966363.1 ATP-binding protein [Streptomyces kunmingensis]
MRRIAAARLRHCGLEALSDEVTLVVSELVTNALLHSGTAEVGVTMAIQDGFLTITVTDGMSGAAVPGLADGDAESGRGLDIVEYVVKEHGGAWGTCEAGAETWCRFALPEEASR